MQRLFVTHCHSLRIQWRAISSSCTTVALKREIVCMAWSIVSQPVRNDQRHRLSPMFCLHGRPTHYKLNIAKGSYLRVAQKGGNVLTNWTTIAYPRPYFKNLVTITSFHDLFSPVCFLIQGFLTALQGNFDYLSTSYFFLGTCQCVFGVVRLF
jgi:hypothetical protein